MDTLTVEKRSENMRRIRCKGMKPEMLVRSLVHRLGYRFRLHAKDLPGKPDLVFRRQRKVIFVDGCFWHGHRCKEGKRVPKSNTGYWTEKIARNRHRDSISRKRLIAEGWKVLTIWECDKEPDIRAKVEKFLPK